MDNYLGRKIIDLNINCSIIICPATTNGYLIGIFLAQYLGIDVYPIDFSNNKRNINFRKIDELELQHKNCLLIDDVITTGDSIRILVTKMLERNIKIEMVLSLFYRDKSKYVELNDELSKNNTKLLSLIRVDLESYTTSTENLINVSEIN